jgi:hypothetical protein
MYRSARRAFGLEGHPPHFGNFRPIALARVLTQAADRELEQARIYTGVPTARRDRKGNAITQRRIAAWINDSPGLIQVFPRPLSYPPPEGREKGVDVELAIDLVRLALDDAYDVAVLASADTDLVPAVQFVVERCENKIVETATWEPAPGNEAVTAAPIDIPGGGATRRTIEQRHFDRIADRRNFVTGTGDPESVVGKTRWDKIKGRLS